MSMIPGPACSNTVEAVAGVSKHYRTAVVTYSAKSFVTHGQHSDNPFYFRTVASNEHNKYVGSKPSKLFGNIN